MLAAEPHAPSPAETARSRGSGGRRCKRQSQRGGGGWIFGAAVRVRAHDRLAADPGRAVKRQRLELHGVARRVDLRAAAALSVSVSPDHTTARPRRWGGALCHHLDRCLAPELSDVVAGPGGVHHHQARPPPDEPVCPGEELVVHQLQPPGQGAAAAAAAVSSEATRQGARGRGGQVGSRAGRRTSGWASWRYWRRC